MLFDILKVQNQESYASTKHRFVIIKKGELLESTILVMATVNQVQKNVISKKQN